MRDMRETNRSHFIKSPKGMLKSLNNDGVYTQTRLNILEKVILAEIC